MSSELRDGERWERADESAAAAHGRVRDRAAERVRRARLFAGLGCLCFVVMLLWVVLLDGPRESLGSTMVKVLLVLAGGVSAVLVFRETDQMRRELTSLAMLAIDQAQKLDRQTMEMREAKERAEEASTVESELFAANSHELRGSLQSITGILQAAIDSGISTEGAQQIDLARRSAHALLATVESARDFTNIEAGRIELEPVYFSIRQLLAGALEPLGITAAEKGLVLAYAVAADVPDRLWGDPQRLRQIIVNLTGNAIKFTSQGEVAVRISCESMSANEVATVIEVSDTGVGIDPLRRSLLFDRYSSLRPRGGSGLGLVIVSRLLEVMGGAITAESEPANGSTFRVILSFPCEPIGTEPSPDWENRLAGVRVLLIEPNATTRSILAEILIAHRMVPEAYATLDRALEPSIRAAYQCLVADGGVLATTPWIPPVPVVRIVSPLAPPIPDGVLVTRPVSERALIDAIGFALRMTGPGIAYTLDRRLDIVRPLRVLIVASDTLQQEVVAEAVRRLGHIGTAATTGAEALDLLVRRTFDVIFVDVQNDHLDGLESAKRFRAVEREGRISMVALTAGSEADERDLCIVGGFDAVLKTPATPAAIGTVIRDVTSSLKLSSGEPAHTGSILDTVGGNARVLRRVRDAFATQIPRLIGAMHTAIEANDGEAIHQSARALRGAIGNFDIPIAIAALIQIERAAAAEDLVRPAELLPEIETAVRELRERMDAALG